MEDRVSAPRSTTAAAVSSHEDSMPRIRPLPFILPVYRSTQCSERSCSPIAEMESQNAESTTRGIGDNTCRPVKRTIQFVILALATLLVSYPVLADASCAPQMSPDCHRMANCCGMTEMPGAEMPGMVKETGTVSAHHRFSA